MVNLLLGCAPSTGLPSASCAPRFHGLPCQSIPDSGTSPSAPSHQTVPSGLRRTFVKIVLRVIVCTILGLVLLFVPGATPKKPVSGLTAHNEPSLSTRIQAISSPTVQTRYPLRFSPSGGTSIARLVLPQALGKAAAMYWICPLGRSTPIISICSASQPSFAAIWLAMRRERHFLPRRTLPP